MGIMENEIDIQSIWSTIYSKVKEHYSAPSNAMVSAFFSNLQPQVMSEEGFFLLTAKNDYIKSWVEQKYLPDIKAVLYELYGREFIVQIEIDMTQPEPAVITSVNNPIVDENPVLTQPKIPSFHKENEETQNHEEKQKINENSVFSTQRFENFVIGDENRAAYQYALQVAGEPGKTNLNPLFIYGGSGFGKTHLLHAIQNEIISTPELSHYKVVYVDTNEFVNSFATASLEHSKNKNSFLNFANKYKEADVLILDDVQYLERKQGTIDIVFQIFNELYQRGKQIIMAADRSPKTIDIDERTQSRFMSGLAIDMRVPTIETKLGIIKQFIEEYKKEGHPEFFIPEEGQLTIAEMSSSNIRELKGAMNRIIAFYHTEKTGKYDTITKTDVEEILKDYFTGGKSKHLSITDIQHEVEKYYGISHNDLIGTKRQQNIVYARQVGIYLCSLLLNATQQKLGAAFGGRDHATIIHSIRVVESRISESREFDEEIKQLKTIIRDK